MGDDVSNTARWEVLFFSEFASDFKTFSQDVQDELLAVKKANQRYDQHLINLAAEQ
jgi:hypothetical protein